MKNKKLLHDIQKSAEEISEEVISLRRHFHENPELGFEEFETSEKIRSVLEEAKIPWERKAKTGITGLIGGKNAITVGLRADMDALPVEEKTGLPFSSRKKGLMHACGHDGHMAVALGVAKVLKKFEKKLKINVKLIFQPSEERMPGGAPMMIKEGALKDVDYLLGFHFFPMLRLFGIWAGSGPVMASADFFSVRIKGKGGHGASPHLSSDPVACAAQMVTDLNTITGRNIDPVKPAVLSVCAVSSGSAFNVIPEEAEIKGTVRTLEDSVKEDIKKFMQAKIDGACLSHGCKASFKYDSFVPSCLNDPDFTLAVNRLAEKIVPEKHMEKYRPVMGSEDFSFFSRKKPSCYIFIGIGDKFAPNHNNGFSIDERALPYTVSFFSSLLASMDSENIAGKNYKGTSEKPLE